MENVEAEEERVQLNNYSTLESQPQIDYVLAWKENMDKDADAGEIKEAQEKRRIFEENLTAEGLILDELDRDEDENINFIRIEAPDEVVRQYAEILKLRKPMKKIPGLPGDAKLTAIFTREREYLFDLYEENFFTPSDRSTVVDFILSRTRYSVNVGGNSISEYGLQRLLKHEVYTGAYPLHDNTTRENLKTEWANLRQSFNTQDLDLVKEYFGVKIGLYFTWLGFYTYMLIPATVVGLICFLYGVSTIYSDQHSMDVCHSNITDLMCPLCNNLCDYWNIKETCFYTRLTYLFDNDATVLFAFLMSIWSAVFIECWKRYSAEISHRWDLTGFDISQEQPRPEYLDRAKRITNESGQTPIRLNRITQDAEPAIAFWKRKMPFTVLSLSAVLFLISLAIAAVLGVIVYRVSVAVAMSGLARKNPGVYSWSLIVVNNTAAIINLIVILIFNWLYSLLAERLTKMEMHRTQTSFENSLVLKMYLLQFVNCYSSIIYVAFFKGKFVGSPHGYTLAFGFRQEECGPGGCMTELCIQLATIMVGNQILNALEEIGLPFLLRQLKKFKFGQFCKGEGELYQPPKKDRSQWAADYQLLDWNQNTLFSEYLEMVLQYGFVTLFVVAFPLAPLFALINNILELRLDARKMLKRYKRPIAQRVKDIGTWYTILSSVSNLAVVSNAFIIAVTSNFIPKLVYRLEFGSLEGFLEHSLARFNTSAPSYVNNTSPLQSIYGGESEVKVCRYQSYRDYYFLPADKKFDRTTFYWEVWMFRLIFVVLFQNIVTTIVAVLKWLIPDVPTKLGDQIRRENYWTMECIIKHEAEQVRKRGGRRRFQSRRRNPMPNNQNENGEQSLSLDEVREQISHLRRSLRQDKTEQSITKQNTSPDGFKSIAEEALANLEIKYEREKLNVSKTMDEVKNQLKLLKEDAATFSEMRVMFAARCEEYAAQVDDLSQQLNAAEDEKKRLDEMLRLAVRQNRELKLLLDWHLNRSQNQISTNERPESDR